MADAWASLPVRPPWRPLKSMAEYKTIEVMIDEDLILLGVHSFWASAMVKYQGRASSSPARTTSKEKVIVLNAENYIWQIPLLQRVRAWYRRVILVELS